MAKKINRRGRGELLFSMWFFQNLIPEYNKKSLDPVSERLQVSAAVLPVELRKFKLSPSFMMATGIGGND